MVTKTLLIVDDEKATRDGLRMALEDNFECYVAADIKQAMSVLKSEPIDLMLTDLRLGGDSGMDLLDQTLLLPSPPISIMMTAYGSVDTAVEAMRRGAWNFVTKPLNLNEIELLLKQAVKNIFQKESLNRLEQETQTLRVKTNTNIHGLEKLIGKSPVIQKIGDLVSQVAPTKATVLIQGESGTGKELIAHAIHQLSGRPNDKFVVVNCAALSPQLLESELFGHEKGAFTGATQKRIGRFEQAHGGTIFLDEIGEIDQSTQVKLLRVLGERSIERVGSNSSIKVDVRIITATNKDLKQLVDDDKFRADLYFRLNVIRVMMPSLKERPEDIILLAQAFLQEFSYDNNKLEKPMTDRALSMLTSYSWPGNVRELRTAIEHGVIMSNDDVIDAHHLPYFLHSNNLKVSTSPIMHLESADLPGTNKRAMEEVEEFNLHVIELNTIKRVLQRTKRNRTDAARLLGISRRTLQRKLKELENS